MLSTMHGAKAFKDFIDKKNTRVPEFLEVVAEHQEPKKTDSEETTQDGRKKPRAAKHCQITIWINGICILSG